MAIGLYTSRVILYELGVIDFGIYSVVGSLSMVFGYLNYSVASSLQRFMSYEIALDNDDGLQQCFSTSLLSGLYLSLIIIFLTETVGLWALADIIDIPVGKEADAHFVYQFAIVILIIEVFKSCCMSLIISEEKMGILAYIYIIESILKLAIVFLLEWFQGDKLRIYILLLVGVGVLVLGCYVALCRIKFPKVRFTLRGGSKRIKEIFSFMGWNVLGSFADVCIIQGGNIVLNVFYGVAYNATIGITNQVKTAVYSFCKNVLAASNPHLTKEFAIRQYESFSRLLNSISVVSCLITFLLGLPVILNTETILNIWLIDIPPSAALFIRLILLFCIIDSLKGPLWVGMQAYGKIRNFQIIITTGWLLSIPAMWLTLKLGGPPQSVLWVQIVVNILMDFIYAYFGIRFCHVGLRPYILNVVLRLFAVIAVSAILPVGVCFITEGITRLVVSTVVTFITVPVTALYLGFPAEERAKALVFIRKKVAFLMPKPTR